MRGCRAHKLLTRSRRPGRHGPPRRIGHLTVPPGRYFRSAFAGLPSIEPGRCFRPVSGGLPPIVLGGGFLTAQHARRRSLLTPPPSGRRTRPNARSRLEEALCALHIALTRRKACPVLGELLANWDGQLTDETRDLVVWHIEECQACAYHKWGALRAASFSRLVPLTPVSPELRERVLSCCPSTAEDAAAYRQQATRRAESIWFTSAIRHLSWASIRANPGVAIAAVAVALWAVAAVSVTLLTFAGSHAAHAHAIRPAGRSSAHAYAPRTSAGTSPRSPAATPAKPSNSPKPSESPSPSSTTSPSSSASATP